jgi:SsrA-binding protein
MKIVNRRAKFDYKLEPERIEAGIALSGGEAKAVRTGHADLSQSVARILNGEVWLINANIPVAGVKDYTSTRSRKLLLHGLEILSLLTKMKQRKLILVPTLMYNKGRLIKVELALGRPKRKFEKKEAIKRKDIKREIERDFRLK